MKTNICLGALIPLLAISALAQNNETSRLEVAERGDHHRVWQRITATTAQNGKTTYQTNAAYTEIETGMHYQKDGQWLESREEIEIVAGNAVARQGRHQVILAANCNSPVAIDMLTPDGKRLQSKVIGLAYFDSASGKMVWIAELKDSVGQVLPPNQVVYIDAFTGFKAHLRYTYTKAGLEQDVILREKPPAPGKFGLDPATTRLQVMTEFLNPPTPKRVAQPLAGAGNLSDESLDFDDMKITRGKAFSLLGERQDRNPIPVGKSWATLEGRFFLIEEVPFSVLEPLLRALPTPQASLNASPKEVLHAVSTQRRLPSVQLAKTSREGMKLASAPLSGPGVVLDYTIVSGGTTYVFKGDTTYYVNGDTRFTGNVTIEGGTVIKFSSTNYSSIYVDGGSVTCQTSPYRPAIFTSRNDNTAGETIAGSTGLPAIDTQGNYDLIISSTNQTTLQYLRVSYCYCGVTAVSGSLAMGHVQFVHTDYPVYIVNTTQCSVRNALIYDVTQVAFEVFNALVTVEHLTLDQCYQLGLNDWQATLALTNSLLVGVSSMGNIPCTSNTVVTLGTNVTVFQTVGAASHYLANGSTNRNAGTTNINASLAADLRKLTTYPPVEITTNLTGNTTLSPQAQRDTDTPDLGYHYDPVDYAWAGLILTNATLQLTNGVVVSTLPGSSVNSAGLYVKSNGKLISEGTPTLLNRLVRYNTVQERAVTNLINNVTLTYLDPSTAAEIRCRFTDWSALSGSADHIVAYYNTIGLTDCRLSASQVFLKGCIVGLTNCLFERVMVDLKDDGMAVDRFLYNNLLRGGKLWLVRDGSGVSLVRDTLFDQTTNTQSGTITHDHNGYINGYPRLTPTNANDVVLTNIPTYLTNWLGKYYYPTNDGMLSVLLNGGSRNATNAGLYHYTVTTNQVTEATSAVDIGFHYVATDSNGVPIDTDGDGLSDYVEDTNGNGVYDAGDLSHFQSLDSDGDGLPNTYEMQTTLTNPGQADTGNTGTTDGYKDSDSDGLTNLEEMKLGKNPLVPDVASPLFSPVGGSYASAQNVVITCPTTGATIRYTLDGSEPTTSSTTIASGSSVLVNQADQVLKAKAWKTSWTTSDTDSQGYRIEGSPSNVAPTLTISPAGGGTFPASASIEILVEAEDSDGTIAKVQLYRGNYKVAETTSSVLRYTVANVPSGTYTFTGKAIDNNGAVTVSSSVTLTISASGPVVSLVGSQPFFTSSSGTLLANITGVNPGALTNLTLNSGHLVPITGEFSLAVALVEGSNTFILSATDNQNRTALATNTVYLDSLSPTLSITNPANNASFGTARVNVRGSFAETSLKQITVNGVPASTSGNSFEARNVPLQAGTNAIVATAQDIAGNTNTAGINLTGTTNGSGVLVDPVQLDATPVGGFTPLVVTFTPHTNLPGTLQNVFYDFNGDNVSDLTTNTMQSITHSYTNGEYFPVVTIQTTAGWFSSAGGWNNSETNQLRINVQAAPQQVGSAITITDPVDLKVTANGHLYVLSRSTSTITEYNTTPASVRTKTSVGTTPTGFDVDANGNVYVALSGDNKVAKYNPTSTSFQLDTTFDTDGLIGSSGSGNGQFNAPYDVAISPDGQEIAVSDSANHRVQRFSTSDGSFLGKFGASGSGVGQFNTPKGLTYDGVGYLYIVDSGNNRIVLALSSAVIGISGSSGTALGQFQGAANLCVGARGIYVAEITNDRVQAFAPISSGDASPTPFTARLSLSTEFATDLDQPNAVAPIPDFLEEKMYIADTGNNRVIKVTLPETTTPDAIWDSMKTSLLGGNIGQAVSYFSSASAEDYRRSFISIGNADLSSVMNKTLTPAVINGDGAQYYFEDVIGGQTITFPVQFVKENGIWKILEF